MLFERVRRVRDTIVDRAMAAALPTCDTRAARQITEALLERGKPEGMLGVVLHYHHLPREVQTQVVDHASQLDRPIREAVGKTHTHGPANAMRILRESGAARLAYLAEQQLRHGDTPMKNKAGDALLDMARRIADEEPTADRAQDAAHLLEAVEQAVEHYDHHRQSAVLQGLLALCPRPMPRAVAALCRRSHPALETLRQMLTLPSSAEARRALLPMAAVPTLTDAVVAGIERLNRGQRGLDDVINASHLLLFGRADAAVKQVADVHGLLPPDDRLASLPDEVAVNLPRWISHLPLTDAQRIDRLARLNVLSQPLARLNALRALMACGDGSDHASSVISGFCFDKQVEIARIALRHLARVRWDGLGRLLPRLVNSEHESVRDLARAYLAPVGFRRLWTAWPKLTYPQRLAAGRALIKIDPQFHAHLGQRLQSPNPHTRIRALSIVKDLNQGAVFEPVIRNIVRDDDEQIASAAVSALGTGDDEDSVPTLTDALDHADGRVRANAVEALAKREQRSHVDRLVDMAVHDENRPRANAIAALMKMNTRNAVALLHRMLADPRVMHRVSALWLVESMGLVELTRQVAELAVADNEGDVRQRAMKVIDSLLASMGAEPIFTQDDRGDLVLRLDEPEAEQSQATVAESEATS